MVACKYARLAFMWGTPAAQLTYLKLQTPSKIASVFPLHYNPLV